MPEINTLVSLFSSVASLVATLTGLIGGFATFRLQRMDAKLDFLKDYILHKEISGDETLNQKLRGTGYLNIEKIYLHNMEAVELLEKLIHKLDYHHHSDEYKCDIQNVTRHQHRYDTIRKHTYKDFSFSLGFVFVSLGLLLFANAVLASSYLWVVLILFFFTTGIVFYRFIVQVKNLIA